MKKTMITLFLISLLTLFIFSIINKLTVSPGTSSGNGNPALLIVWVLIPIFFFMVALWGRVLKAHTIQIKFLFVGTVVIIIYLINSFIYQRKEFVKYQEIIKSALIEKDGYVDTKYLLDITSGLSIHVNNQYFNLNTYFMFLTLSVLVAIFYHVFSRFNVRSKTLKK